MKVLDGIVLVVFLVALIVLSFFQQCSLDIYFLVFGFAIALMSAITLFMQTNRNKEKNSQSV